jgi:hypothetical protein
VKHASNRNSEIVYYNEDGKSYSYFEYKKGDYFSHDELHKLFSYFYRRIHSTGGNFYMLELAMGNKNKNNKRFIIADKMYYYTICQEEAEGQIEYECHDFKRPRFTLNDLQK